MALEVKNQIASAEDVRDVGSVPGWGRLPGGGRGSILAWRIPRTEGPGGHVGTESDTTDST